MSGDSNWIELDEGLNKPFDGNYISMNGNGLISMNRQMHEAMNRPEAVILLFDPINSRIGHRPRTRICQTHFRSRESAHTESTGSMPGVLPENGTSDSIAPSFSGRPNSTMAPWCSISRAGRKWSPPPEKAPAPDPIALPVCCSFYPFCYSFR